MRAIPLLALLLSGWFAVPAHADEAQDWLTRLGRAEQQQSFQGTFIYERNGSFLPMTSGIVSRMVRSVSGFCSSMVLPRKSCASMAVPNA